MIEDKIEKLKNKLDHLIENGASKEEIYNASVEIDKAINEFYKKNKLGETSK